MVDELLCQPAFFVLQRREFCRSSGTTQQRTTCRTRSYCQQTACSINAHASLQHALVVDVLAGICQLSYLRAKVLPRCQQVSMLSWSCCCCCWSQKPCHIMPADAAYLLAAVLHLLLEPALQHMHRAEQTLVSTMGMLLKRLLLSCCCRTSASLSASCCGTCTSPSQYSSVSSCSVMCCSFSLHDPSPFRFAR
jgi:hypothetical protein